MVIVTQNQYILASKIHHITMDEQINYREVVINSRQNTVKEEYFQITIVYSPQDVNTQTQSHRSSDDMRECSVIIQSKFNAHKVFKDLIEQIREQMPDQLYLDKALERMLGSLDKEKMVEDYEGNAKHVLLSMEEKRHDRKSKKIRGVRKTKGRGKGLLRPAKSSSRKRR